MEEFLSLNQFLHRADGLGQAAWRKDMLNMLVKERGLCLLPSPMNLGGELPPVTRILKLISDLKHPDCRIAYLLLEDPGCLPRELQESTLCTLLQALKKRQVRVLMPPSQASKRFGRAEVSLNSPAALAERWSRENRIVVKNLERSNKPIWLTSDKGRDQFDLQGVWTVWTALRLYFDGESIECIARAFNDANSAKNEPKAYPQARAASTGWTAEHVRQLLLPYSERFTFASPAYGNELVDRLNIVDIDVFQVLVDAYGRRALANRGKPAAREQLFKGIPVECRCGRRLEADPSSSKPIRCALNDCSVKGKTQADIDAYARQAVSRHFAERRMLVWELGNPFQGDADLIQDVARLMNSEIERCEGDDGERILMERVRQRLGHSKRSRSSQLQLALELLSKPWSSERNEKASDGDYRRLRLAILRRVKRIVIGSGSQPATLTAHRGGVLHSVDTVGPISS